MTDILETKPAITEIQSETAKQVDNIIKGIEDNKDSSPELQDNLNTQFMSALMTEPNLLNKLKTIIESKYTGISNPEELQKKYGEDAEDIQTLRDFIEDTEAQILHTQDLMLYRDFTTSILPPQLSDIPITRTRTVENSYTGGEIQDKLTELVREGDTGKYRTTIQHLDKFYKTGRGDIKAIQNMLLQDSQILQELQSHFQMEQKNIEKNLKDNQYGPISEKGVELWITKVQDHINLGKKIQEFDEGYTKNQIDRLQGQKIKEQAKKDLEKAISNPEIEEDPVTTIPEKPNEETVNGLNLFPEDLKNDDIKKSLQIFHHAEKIESINDETTRNKIMDLNRQLPEEIQKKLDIEDLLKEVKDIKKKSSSLNMDNPEDREKNNQYGRRMRTIKEKIINKLQKGAIRAMKETIATQNTENRKKWTKMQEIEDNPNITNEEKKSRINNLGINAQAVEKRHQTMENGGIIFKGPSDNPKVTFKGQLKKYFKDDNEA